MPVVEGYDIQKVISERAKHVADAEWARKQALEHQQKCAEGMTKARAFLKEIRYFLSFLETEEVMACETTSYPKEIAYVVDAGGVTVVLTRRVVYPYQIADRINAKAEREEIEKQAADVSKVNGTEALALLHNTFPELAPDPDHIELARLEDDGVPRAGDVVTGTGRELYTAELVRNEDGQLMFIGSQTVDAILSGLEVGRIYDGAAVAHAMAKSTHAGAKRETFPEAGV